jgi:hypothetical protein
LTTARRGLRSGLDLVLFVCTLVLGVSLSLVTHVVPSGAVEPIGRWSAAHLMNAADAGCAHQLTNNGRNAAPDDAADEDDDSDDGDDVCALPTVASPGPKVDRTLRWLLFHAVFEALSSRAADNHSLRAPPQ